MNDNNKFAQQISISNKMEFNLTENTLALDVRAINKLSTELEIEPIIISVPQYKTIIKTDETDRKQLGFDDKFLGENTFFIWLAATKYQAYFLVGTQIQFFEKEDEPNLFKKSNQFMEYSEKIKTKLGLEHAMPYESEGGFYLFTSTLNSQQMSFFAYKI